MNDNLLISTAMLSAYWEKERKDTFDLLMPFLKYSIAKTTAKGEKINVEKVTEFFKQEFGYDTIPMNVIPLMLKRLSPNSLSKDKNEYTLKVSLDSEIEKFEKGHIQFEERRSKVVKKLNAYLDEHLIMPKQCTEKETMDILISFFVTNGICIVRDVAFLETLKKKDDRIKYCVAQFILEEYEKRTEVFSYIVDMVKGFFVSMAISIQSPNGDSAKSKLNGLNCYIDTRIILMALGLHLPDQRKAAAELLNMLKEKGATLYCFTHNYDEVYDIISAYKHSLSHPYRSKTSQTLEGWDMQSITLTEVENYQSLLKNKIGKLGITVIDKPSVNDAKHCLVDEVAFRNYISDNVGYKNKDAASEDVQSVTSILSLRKGKKNTEIEKCEHIFVTANLALVIHTNSYLTNNGVCNLNKEFSCIISDADLSAIVWLKCYSNHKDYPTQKLIECAKYALEPTASMMDTFFEMVDHIQADGGISEDEAAILCTDRFCRKALAGIAKGDENSIDALTVYDVRDKLKQRYMGESEEQARLNYQKYEEEREKQRKILQNAHEEIRRVGQTRYDKIYKILNLGANIILVILNICLLITVFADVDAIKGVGAWIVLIVGVVGNIDFLSFQKSRVKKLIKRIACHAKDWEMDKKREEYEKILGMDMYDTLL